MKNDRDTTTFSDRRKIFEFMQLYARKAMVAAKTLHFWLHRFDSRTGLGKFAIVRIDNLPQHTREMCAFRFSNAVWWQVNVHINSRRNCILLSPASRIRISDSKISHECIFNCD